MHQYPRFAVLTILLLIGGIGAIIDENVDFFEKYAPKINAALHSGEITSTGDGEYNIAKWLEDRGKLDADFQSKDWQTYRQEVLRRKPYLDDLMQRNDTIQRRLQVEAAQHLDANDPCESVTIHEGGPIIAKYTQTEKEFYSLMKKSETPTPKVKAELDELDNKDAELKKQLSEFSEHWQAKGCK